MFPDVKEPSIQNTQQNSNFQKFRELNNVAHYDKQNN